MSSDLVFFFKRKTAYESRISDWSSDVCSSDLIGIGLQPRRQRLAGHDLHVDTGIGPAEIGHTRHQAKGREGEVGGKAHRRRAGAPSDRQHRLVEPLEALADRGLQRLALAGELEPARPDRKSTRLNSSH